MNHQPQQQPEPSDDESLRAEIVSQKHVEQLLKASTIHAELCNTCEGDIHHSFLRLYDDMDLDKDERIQNDVLSLQSALDTLIGHAMLLRGEIGSYLTTE